jgi:hypothetical protein
MRSPSGTNAGDSFVVTFWTNDMIDFLVPVSFHDGSEPCASTAGTSHEAEHTPDIRMTETRILFLRCSGNY